MFFRYPDKFIVPVDLFRKENSVNKTIIRIDNEININTVRLEYEKDKLVWINIDDYYSKNETGTFYNN